MAKLRPLKPTGKLKPRFQHDCDSCIHLATIRLQRWFDLYLCERCDGGTLIARFSSEGPDYSSYPIGIWERVRSEHPTIMDNGGSYRSPLTSAQHNPAMEFAYVEWMRLKGITSRLWEIYFSADYELAHIEAPELLGVVEAPTRAEAVRIAATRNMGDGRSTLIAVPKKVQAA
jgi:hypothetical protein